MLPLEHSAKLSTCIKLPLVIKIVFFVLFELPLKTDFPVSKLPLLEAPSCTHMRICVYVGTSLLTLLHSNAGRKTCFHHLGWTRDCQSLTGSWYICKTAMLVLWRQPGKPKVILSVTWVKYDSTFLSLLTRNIQKLDFQSVFRKYPIGPFTFSHRQSETLFLHGG